MGESGMALLAVATGSALGGVSRFLLTEWAMRAIGPGFPWGTLIVNLAGCFLIGGSSVLVTANWPGTWASATRLGFSSGVLGGFTTFSAFAVQATGLAGEGRMVQAVAYVGASVGFGLLACWLGAWISEQVIR